MFFMDERCGGVAAPGWRSRTLIGSSQAFMLAVVLPVLWTGSLGLARSKRAFQARPPQRVTRADVSAVIRPRPH